MKKLVSILLALAMILCMGLTAFAEDTITTDLTITDSTGRTYAGYKLLSVTTSLKTGEHHTAHEGSDHVDSCYNYAYTVNPTYREILQKEAFDNGGNYLWGEAGRPAEVAKVTDDQILKYLENQTTTMSVVADRIYRAIQAAGITPDEADLTGNDNIEQGYWMIADVTDLDGKNQANSLVMVDTKGQNALTITPKTALPTVEKKVKDIEDSEDSNILDNAWHDSADHDFGDDVPFKLTATLPSNAMSYKTFKLVFHDTLSAGLTFDATSVKVYKYDTKHKADVDTDLNEGVVVTDNFVVTSTGLTDDCTFEVSCADVLKIDGVTKETAFVVYYEATLNEAAVTGSAGNPNEVYLEFSNDPYGGTTGVTEEDVVTVFTYQVIVNKTDAHGHKLEGAGFTLYKRVLGVNTGADEDGYVVIGTELKGEDMTTFTWTGLDDGDYKLVESTVPAGYNKMDDIKFSISAVHSETDGNPTLISLDGGLMGTGVVETGAITKDIVNNTGTVLPETGAQGTVMLISVSAVFVIIATVFMITRKKMSIYED